MSEAEVEYIIEKVISPCQMNGQYYGRSNETLKVDFIFEFSSGQRKTLPRRFPHYAQLIDLLFPTVTQERRVSVSTNLNTHVNSFNGEHTDVTSPLFHVMWQPNGDAECNVDELTTNLKLFFSSSSIDNGNWIQFHGLGTTIFTIAPALELSLGALCDPTNEYNFPPEPPPEEATSPDDGVMDPKASPYRIRIKWTY